MRSCASCAAIDGHPIDRIEPVVSGADLPALRAELVAIHVDPMLEGYLMDIVEGTRSHPDLALGASVRGSLALFDTARALAAARGRDYLLPDDIKEMALVTLPHRLVVKPESRLRGVTQEAVVTSILESIDLLAAELA